MNTLLEINPSILPGTDLHAAPSRPTFLNTVFEENSVLEQKELTPQLATDSALLNEVYRLRLDVWEHSGNTAFVNRNLYPDGWYDELDATAFHWIVANDENKIIASARLNLFYSFADFPYYSSVQKFLLPQKWPFGFYSRLVVHPDYRKNGLSRKLFHSRDVFCQQMGVQWSQTFINNPFIMCQYEKSGFLNIGKAEVAYHPSEHPHVVNVFIKMNENF
jgi:predicted GNAT family N-acyltransferase